MTYEEYLENKYEYQQEAVDFLVQAKHGCLFMEPGLAKTYPAIEAAKQVCGKNDFVLVISSLTSIKDMWIREIDVQKCLLRVVYINWEKLINSITFDKLSSVKWKCIIADEVHRSKNKETATGKAFKKLTQRTEYVFGLTGTPSDSKNSTADNYWAGEPMDIYGIFHTMFIQPFASLNKREFTENFCITYEVPYGKIYRLQKVKAQLFDKLVSKAAYRLSYKDAKEKYGIEMPDLKFETVEFNMIPSKQYEAAKECVKLIENQESTTNKMTSLLLMQEAANGFLYDDDKNAIWHCKPEDLPKIKWLKTQNKKYILVCRFKTEEETLLKLIPKSTTNVDMFDNSKDMVLIRNSAACESLNLQSCNRVVFYTMTFVWRHFKQMFHRAWRTGQLNETTVIILKYKDSIEDSIEEAIKSKKSAHELFMTVKERI